MYSIDTIQKAIANQLINTIIIPVILLIVVLTVLRLSGLLILARVTSCPFCTSPQSPRG